MYDRHTQIPSIIFSMSGVLSSVIGNRRGPHAKNNKSRGTIHSCKPVWINSLYQRSFDYITMSLFLTLPPNPNNFPTAVNYPDTYCHLWERGSVYLFCHCASNHTTFAGYKRSIPSYEAAFSLAQKSHSLMVIFKKLQFLFQLTSYANRSVHPHDCRLLDANQTEYLRQLRLPLSPTPNRVSNGGQNHSSSRRWAHGSSPTWAECICIFV